MHIGFDAKRAFLNNSGLGNHSRTLLKSLAEFYPENKYLLYTPDIKQNPTTNFLFEDNYLIRQPSGKMPKSLWRSRFILSDFKKDNLDLYHGLSHELPFGIKKAGIPSVVTIHDLIFLRYPKLYPTIDRKIYAAKVKYACRCADAIIAISEQTKRDILQFTDTKAEKITVIYQSCSEDFSPNYSKSIVQDIRQKYHLPEQYLLYVGTIEERKNLLLIAKALKQLPKDLICVAVGKKTTYYEKVKAFLDHEGLQGRILFFENLPASDLPLFYQSAILFIYPSRFEGFGIPVLEAISSGLPVITATGSCLEEVGGPDSLYINPDDADALIRGIRKVIESPDLLKSMSQSGLNYAKKFSPDLIAKKVMTLYRQIIP